MTGRLGGGPVTAARATAASAVGRVRRAAPARRRGSAARGRRAAPPRGSRPRPATPHGSRKGLRRTPPRLPPRGGRRRRVPPARGRGLRLPAACGPPAETAAGPAETAARLRRGSAAGRPRRATTAPVGWPAVARPADLRDPAAAPRGPPRAEASTVAGRVACRSSVWPRPAAGAAAGPVGNGRRCGRRHKRARGHGYADDRGAGGPRQGRSPEARTAPIYRDRRRAPPRAAIRPHRGARGRRRGRTHGESR